MKAPVKGRFGNRFILASVAATSLLGQAFAQTSPEPDPRIDAASGRLLATWPRDRLFDFVHMRLELAFPDMGKAELEGVETLTLVPIGEGRGSVTLDCDGPVITQATLNGRACEFSQEGKKLAVRFPSPLGKAETGTLSLHYTLEFSKNRGDGLTYSKPRTGNDLSLTYASPQIHAQGQAELNSKWFPCFDHPSEKLTTELIVDVEDDFDVVSNGFLKGKAKGQPGRTRWHWSQDTVHCNYLVTLVVGKFARVDLVNEDGSTPRMPMPVFTPHGTEDNVRVTFARTPQMLRFFEERFATPYPWRQYAQCNVRDFAAGGMENTGCTLLTVATSRKAPAGAFDDLISHELAHQWFGDLVTCKSWDHLWLNEGWANFSEALWAEQRGAKESPEKARSEYHRAILGFARSQRGRNRGSAPRSPALVSNRFTDPDRVFTKSDDPYAKGAMILHMLRRRIGDDAFFTATKVYLDRFAYKTVETDDLRRVFEEVSGQSLERFFDQWCMRPGLPRLSVTQDWNDASSTLTVSVEQTQDVDPLNPAYAITVPVLVKLGETDNRWLYIDMDTKSASSSITLPSKPTQVTVDPNVTVLAAVKIDKPLTMWLDQAEHGETLAARCDAVDHLATLNDPTTLNLLARIAADDSAPDLLRSAASTSLAARAQ